MTKLLLTQSDYEEAAREIGCNVAAIRAVREVEAPKGGFLEDGRLTILFERHKFHQFTKGKYSVEANQAFAWPQPGGYTRHNEWERFNRAAVYDLEAAKLSASYGFPQVMGFNFGVAGYKSVDELLADFNTGEPAQLRAFIRLIFAWDLDDELARVSRIHPGPEKRVARLAEWQRVARVWNGKNFRTNDYDNRLEEGYQQWLDLTRLKLAQQVVPVTATNG